MYFVYVAAGDTMGINVIDSFILQAILNSFR